MTMSALAPVTCPKCGYKQYYELLLSWNSFCNTPINDNKCICGYQLTEDDIIIEKCDAIVKYILSDRNK